AAASAPTPDQLRRGRALIVAAVTAHGGAAKLAAAHEVTVEGDLTLYAGGQQVTGQYSAIRRDPSRLVTMTRLFSFENRQVLDGDRGWTLAVAESAQVQNADSSGLESLRHILAGDLVHVLRAAADPAAAAAWRGREKIGLRTCDLVEFGAGGVPTTRLAVDPVTHRITAVDAGPTAAGAWRDRRLWSDYRPVGGLLLPHLEERWLDGDHVSTFRVRRTAVNAAVDTTLFRYPDVRHGQLLDR
ncbi:MAG TPA: hypothetical protein VGU27_08620, partial [Candidatus Eisenbacteria bacterium]|nr:hypothetical protein [Candidatus Eisenbacteria bacterium]